MATKKPIIVSSGARLLYDEIASLLSKVGLSISHDTSWSKGASPTQVPNYSTSNTDVGEYRDLKSNVRSSARTQVLSKLLRAAAESGVLPEKFLGKRKNYPYELANQLDRFKTAADLTRQGEARQRLILQPPESGLQETLLPREAEKINLKGTTGNPLFVKLPGIGPTDATGANKPAARHMPLMLSESDLAEIVQRIEAKPRNETGYFLPKKGMSPIAPISNASQALSVATLKKLIKEAAGETGTRGAKIVESVGEVATPTSRKPEETTYSATYKVKDGKLEEDISVPRTNVKNKIIKGEESDQIRGVSGSAPIRTAEDEAAVSQANLKTVDKEYVDPKTGKKITYTDRARVGTKFASEDPAERAAALAQFKAKAQDIFREAKLDFQDASMRSKAKFGARPVIDKPRELDTTPIKEFNFDLPNTVSKIQDKDSGQFLFKSRYTNKPATSSDLVTALEGFIQEQNAIIENPKSTPIQIRAAKKEIVNAKPTLQKMSKVDETINAAQDPKYTDKGDSPTSYNEVAATSSTPPVRRQGASDPVEVEEGMGGQQGANESYKESIREGKTRAELQGGKFKAVIKSQEGDIVSNQTKIAPASLSWKRQLEIDNFKAKAEAAGMSKAQIDDMLLEIESKIPLAQKPVYKDPDPENSGPHGVSLIGKGVPQKIDGKEIPGPVTRFIEKRDNIPESEGGPGRPAWKQQKMIGGRVGAAKGTRGQLKALEIASDVAVRDQQVNKSVADWEKSTGNKATPAQIDAVRKGVSERMVAQSAEAAQSAKKGEYPRLVHTVTKGKGIQKPFDGDKGAQMITSNYAKSAEELGILDSAEKNTQLKLQSRIDAATQKLVKSAKNDPEKMFNGLNDMIDKLSEQLNLSKETVMQIARRNQSIDTFYKQEMGGRLGVDMSGLASSTPKSPPNISKVRSAINQEIQRRSTNNLAGGTKEDAFKALRMLADLTKQKITPPLTVQQIEDRVLAQIKRGTVGQVDPKGKMIPSYQGPATPPETTTRLQSVRLHSEPMGVKTSYPNYRTSPKTYVSETAEAPSSGKAKKITAREVKEKRKQRGRYLKGGIERENPLHFYSLGQNAPGSAPI